MARYIDESEIKFTGYTFADVNNEVYVKVEDVRKAIAQTPTADVAEVVRCKDCKHWRTEHGGFCEASNALSEVNNVIPLPCKVGDTVYDISEFFDGTNHPEIYEYDVSCIHIEKEKGKQIFYIDDLKYPSNDWGKTLHFSREEALAKLKEGGNK